MPAGRHGCPPVHFLPRRSLRPLRVTALTLTLAGLALTSITSPALKERVLGSEACPPRHPEGELYLSPLRLGHPTAWTPLRPSPPSTRRAAPPGRRGPPAWSG